MATYIEDFRRGDTKVFQLDYGKGVDITGWTFYFFLKENLDDTQNVLQVSHVAGDNPADDLENGLAYLTLTSDDTKNIAANKYYYGLKVDKGGSPSVIKTILPPVDDPKDRVTIIEGFDIV